MNKKPYLIAIAITALAFIIRLIGAFSIWVGGDEGNFLYDALMWNKGLVPFKDFLLGSPLLIFMMRFTTMLFGRTLFSGRVISVVLSSATVYLIFLVGKRLWNEKVGLISALIFALSPFTIFYGSMIKTEPNVSFFVVFSFYVFIVSYQKDKSILMLLSGLLLGAAACIRLSAFVFQLVLIAFLAYYYLRQQRSIKKFLISASLLSFGFAVPYLTMTFLLSLGSSFKDTFYGWSPAGVTVRHNWSLLKSLLTKFNLVTIWLYKISYDGSYFIIFTILFVGLVFKRFINNKRVYAGIFYSLLILYGIIFLKSVLSIIWSWVLEYSGFWYLNNEFILAFFSITFLLIVLMIISGISMINYFNNKTETGSNVQSKSDIGHINGDASIFVLFWFFIVLFFYFIYSLQPSYFYELSVPASFFGGYLLVMFFKERMFSYKLFLIVLGILMILPYSFYQQKHGFSNFWSLGDINKISNYLSKTGLGNKKGDVFFTANTVILYTNDLESFGNISHPVIYYSYPKIPERRLEMSHLPAVKTIVTAMDSGEIKYVLQDKRTTNIFKWIYPELIIAINRNYRPVKKVGHSVILRHKKR